MLYSVPKSWVGETCVIIAGGPSLRTQDFSPLNKYRPQIITVNDSWRLRPAANVLYFCDTKWWEQQIYANHFCVNDRVRFHDLIYNGNWIKGGEGFEDHPQVQKLKFTGQQGLETDPTGLRHGSNSTYQAMNLAYHFGVKKIILLGVDMRISESGKSHWHDEHRALGFHNVIKNTMLPQFQHLVEPLKAAGVEVINATPGSALTLWEHKSLEDALGQ
jgi:hypothetical protein